MFKLDEQDQQQLLNIAQESIQHGLEHGKQLNIEQSKYSESLQNPGAVFVTLKCSGLLRGCTGTLEAVHPLVSAVAHFSYHSAFHDPRFPPLEFPELVNLSISISVLSPKEELSFASEEDVINQIRPGTDGLVVEYSGQRGTLLPSVWESISDKYDFFCTVKQKAGFEREFWSDSMRVYRYTTHTINE